MAQFKRSKLCFYLPLKMESITRSLLSESQYPAMAATAPIKMEVNTKSPLAANVPNAHSTTPKNICCRTSISSSWMSSKRPFSSDAEERQEYISDFRNIILCYIMWFKCKKVIILVFFAHKKYSRSFVKLQLNPWCHMDYFNDLLAMFLDLDHVRILAVYGGSESSRDASKIT